jgi:hypothetical protein
MSCDTEDGPRGTGDFRMKFRNLLLAMIACASLATGAEKPNVLILLADDLAWHDVGCFRS